MARHSPLWPGPSSGFAERVTRRAWYCWPTMHRCCQRGSSPLLPPLLRHLPRLRWLGSVFSAVPDSNSRVSMLESIHNVGTLRGRGMYYLYANLLLWAWTCPECCRRAWYNCGCSTSLLVLSHEAAGHDVGIFRRDGSSR